MLKLAYNRLLTNNYKGMFLFYRDVLGFKPCYGDENDVYGEFETGDTTIALFMREFMSGVVGTGDKPTDADAQDRVAFIFEVESVDESTVTLKSRGAEFITQPEDRPEWGIRTSHFRDPDGNLIELYHRLSV
ncbi:MAG: VOC family protein [Chthonomonadales bacterium]